MVSIMFIFWKSLDNLGTIEMMTMTLLMMFSVSPCSCLTYLLSMVRYPSRIPPIFSLNEGLIICQIRSIPYLSIKKTSLEENMKMATMRLNTCWSAMIGNCSSLRRETNRCFILVSNGISSRILPIFSA